MNKKSIRDIDVNGKKVFIRVDFNVPMDENQNITNDKRIRATLPTLNYLLEHNAALILACHVGRPKGQRVPEMSVKPIVKRLSELLGREVKYAEDCVGEAAQKAAADLKPGEVLLLENLRYHNEETKNDPEFAKQLASLADVAVDDAFGVSHRAHASNAGIAQYVEVVAGFLIEAGLLEETRYLHLKATRAGALMASSLPLEGEPAKTAEAPGTPDDERPEAEAASAGERLFERLLRASCDPAAEGKPSGTAFEEEIAEAFRYMGFDAKRLGGPGNTDVLVRWSDDEGGSFAAVVEGKSKSGGAVYHTDISDVSIDAHMEKAAATFEKPYSSSPTGCHGSLSS